MKKIFKILVFIIITIWCLSANAQFYNGHQMSFGKNRVQFEEYEWYFFRFERFDTYFYAGSKDVALQTASIANNNITEIENLFEHQLQKRIVFVIYQNLSDFRQSNIGLNTGDEQYNIGGVTKVIDNIAFLFLEGDIESLEVQIKSAIANVITNEMMFGSELGTRVANTTLINMPEWYISGLIAYVSEDWDSQTDNENKNAIMSGKYKNYNQLTGKDAKIAGKAVWNYIHQTYGPQVIPNIVYLTRVTKSIESGFLYVLGISLSMLQQNLEDYYKIQYQAFDYNASVPEGKDLISKTRKHTEYYQLRYNSNSKKVAWVENKQGKYWIKVKDLETDKTKTILKREHKLEQITDLSYPILRWHPSGILLGFIIEKKGETYYCTYNFDSNEFKEVEMTAMEKISSFDYSHDGLSLVLAGFRSGQSDIYIFNIAANTLTNITQDNADDYEPVFVNKSQQIVFGSKRDAEIIGDRRNNEVPLQKHKDIYVYDLTSKTISRITETALMTETNPDLKFKNYTYLSNETGIENLFSAKIDSAVSFVDTITHYRYFLNTNQLTNYQYNIIEYSADKFTKESTFLYKENGKYRLLFNTDLPNKVSNSEKTLARRNYEQREVNRIVKKSNLDLDNNLRDSLALIILDPDVQNIDINNYVFDQKTLQTVKSDAEEFDEKGRAKEPRTNKYFTTFYTNYLVSQVDFGFLSNSYQTFTGSAFYFNPGFNLIMKIGTSDLFEDYRITAGFRFAGNFDSNEYLISFENLKNRWNKQLILHRQVLNNYFDFKYVKTFTHEAFYVMRYPFSQVDAVQFTGNIRQNQNSFLSIDYQSLLAQNTYNYWASIKAEYIFDNTKQITTNILSGTRFKAFGEFYKQLDKQQTDLFVTGADFRYYQPIHKNLIFAGRIATSSSFGKAKLIYYLGGMDNWINLSNRVPTFNSNIRIDPEINYVYQAVATNLRGFSQNIRNGTNFAVVNAEIRWPIISYLYKRPVNNTFLRHFQVISFFDIGSAWSGLTPFSGNNAYENDYYENNPVTVIIHNENYPIVSGYGFGLRSKIFGYFFRADWAWGINNNVIQPRMFYLSLSTDF